MAGYIPRWCSCPQTVTHPSINRAWRRVTCWMATNALWLSQTTNLHCSLASITRLKQNSNKFVMPTFWGQKISQLLPPWRRSSPLSRQVCWQSSLSVLTVLVRNGNIIAWTSFTIRSFTTPALQKHPKKTETHFSHTARFLFIVIILFKILTGCHNYFHMLWRCWLSECIWPAPAIPQVNFRMTNLE